MKNLIVILGATASGKTELATRLAYDVKGEIVSADSRQVYKGMDIGTGKDLSQYIVCGKMIPYHLIDIIEPDNEFNVFEFQKRFYDIFCKLRNNNVLPILVGGTGLYLESVLTEYKMPIAPLDEHLRKECASKTIEELQYLLFALKPQLHNKTDLEDKDRLIRAIEIEQARRANESHYEKMPVIDPLIFGIRWDRSELRNRITLRLKERLQSGMIEEVKSLHDCGLSWARLESFGLEYRWISFYLQNRISWDEMTEKLNTAIHQFAKKQETWFRRMEKKEINICWIDGNDYQALKESVNKLIHEKTHITE